MIAANTQHTGDGRRDHRGYAEPMTSEQLDRLLSEDWLRQMVADIRGGNEALKDRLPFICPHYAAFRNNHRAQADILPDQFTFMTCVDVDDLQMVDQAISKAQQLNQDDYSDWQDQVLRIVYSARKKVHIYIRIPKGMTIEEAQLAFCKEMEVPYDESCITPERFIFITGKDEEIYRSPHWLEPLSQEELAERREAYLNRGLDMDGRPLKKEAGKAKKAETQSQDASIQAPTARTRYIFDQCMKEAEVEPAFLIDEGARHNSLKAILSVGATQLLKKEELMGVLSEKMKAHWQDDNIQTLVNDFYEKYTDSSRRMTQFERKVFASSQKIVNGSVAVDQKNDLEAGGFEDCDESNAVAQSELSRLFVSSTPPPLPATLPRLVKAVTCNTPDIYKATVAQAMFAPLGAYPRKLSFVYIDNQVRELRINCLVVGETGSGKDICTKQPLTHIIADMKARDKINRDRLKQFNEEYNSKAGNKQKPQRPSDLVIQNVKNDITKAALVQRMDEANGAPLYVRLNEIEQWDRIEGASGRSNQFTTLKLCDDELNDFGSDRASTQSVTGDGCLHMNWNGNTTTSKLIRYFRHVLTDGPVSRLCMATIPEAEIGADIPVFGNYDQAYDDALKPYIDNLKNATGVIDCIQARRLAKNLKKECAEFAGLSQDKIFDNLSHRALVMAFRKACLLYVANGMKWEKSIETFCRWSLFYDLYLKMTLFGNLIRRADDDIPINKRGPRSLLELLPDEFTIEDAQRVRQREGKDASLKETNHMIRTWTDRGHCAQSTEHSFKKTEEFKKKNG